MEFNSVTNNDGRDEVFATLDISLRNGARERDATLKVKVDTGAQGNILPARTFKRMFPELLDESGVPSKQHLRHRPTILTAYNGAAMTHHGTIVIPCSYGERQCDTEFYVVETPGPVILGLPTSRDLNLVTLNCAVTKGVTINSTDDLKRAYPDRFQGIGNFEGHFHITTDPDATPVVYAPRRCPIALKDEIEREIETMEEMGVISRVSKPTDWVSSLVYSRKSSGRLRICLDPKDLNRANKRPHYHNRTLEEITHKLAGATVLSKLDARHGYWSVSLDEESSMKTTFNSPFGRYRFLRLPFGLNSSQDVFQERMDLILEQCPGTISIADDVGVFGRTEEEHNANLHQLMQATQKHGLVFNGNKCKIDTSQLHFFGLVFDANGVHPDPARMDDFCRMTKPANADELREFLGIATYMSPFIPKLSANTATLRDLIKKVAVFAWNSSHDKAFESTKKLICHEVTLAYFKLGADTVIQVDASGRDMGAVLMQAGKPIAFASKSLSDCETRYANIEREMLAVVFGCERFDTYVYGTRFSVESDHEPLEMIILKNLAAAPQILQRMLLRTQPYDVQIRYRPGKEMALADTLSRQPCPDNKTIELDVQISYAQFSTRKLDDLRRETRNDSELQNLLKVIVDGWPDRQRDVHPQLRSFWAYRDELVADDGIVLKGNRIVMPESLHSETLAKLHEAHQGIEKMRLRARSCVFWNGINRDIEVVVRKCATCQEVQRAQPREPLMPHETPSRAWQIVGTDLFVINRETYLLVPDYYSKFPFVYVIPSPVTSTAVITKMKSLFAEQGVPQRVISDNGGHFSSDAHLKQGTRPSKKITNAKDVKRYLNVASIARDGMLVVRRNDPLSPSRECIIVPRMVLNGLVTALHIQLDHPSAHQLKQVMRRYLFALDLDRAIETTSHSCHHYASLINTPTMTVPQSTSDPPEVVGISYAADIIKRERQLILVLRECVTSYTACCFVTDERRDTIRDSLINLCIGLRPLDGPPAVIRTYPAPGFAALANDAVLAKYRLTIELGRVKNVNKNPVAEKAVRELECELLHQQPTGGTVTQLVLSVATANLNTRIRNKGFSARELWTQRDQFTNEQLPLTDYNLIRQQHALRNANHAHSQLSKSHDGALPKSQHIDVGDIVYLYADRNKTRSRCRYIVVSTDGSWLNISKFIGTQLRATSYRVKRSECYKVVANTPDSTVTYEYEDEIDAPIPDATPEPLPSIPAQLSYPALPDEAQPVQPAPQHQPLIASDEKTQDSADEQDFPTEQLPRRSTRVRKPPDYLRF